MSRGRLALCHAHFPKQRVDGLELWRGERVSGGVELTGEGDHHPPHRVPLVQQGDGAGRLEGRCVESHRAGREGEE
eukprot:scaffold9372_cov23-Tisochrysis_lutea.AAC.2